MAPGAGAGGPTSTGGVTRSAGPVCGGAEAGRSATIRWPATATSVFWAAVSCPVGLVVRHFSAPVARSSACSTPAREPT